MAKALKNYNQDDAVCVNCIEDQYLRERLRAKSHDLACVKCGEESIAISISDLAKFIDPFIREHYEPGHYERQATDDDSDPEEQQGDDLYNVVEEVIGNHYEFIDALVDALIKNDTVYSKHCEESFYDDSSLYEGRELEVDHLHKKWKAISNEIGSQRRFFNKTSHEFFDWLFVGIEDLWFLEKNSTLPSEQPKTRVIQEWPAGTILYRARRADTKDDYTKLLVNPSEELAPPPPKYARAGRMNAEGITIFYGGLDAETCLAEMRSSIGGYNVIGRFETIKPLRVLDLSRLDKANSDGKELSYFQCDFDEQAARHKFRRRLHKLISEPVITGHEDEYLITQVLAEYLAYVHSANFDGLLFASTQYKDGTNVVLFPKNTEAPLENETDNMSLRFSLKYVDESVKIYKTRGIKYDIRKVDYFLDDDKVHLYKPYYDEDDDS
jgi:RES domain